MEYMGNRLDQEQHSDAQKSNLAGVRLSKKSGTRVEELTQVSTVFRLLAKNSENQATATQWREFTKNLSKKLEQETAQAKHFPALQTLRDRFQATDSLFIRICGFAAILVVLGLIAAFVWAVTLLAFAQFSPVSGAATGFVGGSSDKVALVKLEKAPASVPCEKEAKAFTV